MKRTYWTAKDYRLSGNHQQHEQQRYYSQYERNNFNNAIRCESASCVNDVKLNNSSTLSAKLITGQMFTLLIDTGASRSLISEKLVNTHEYLYQLPVTRIQHPLFFNCW